MELRDVFTVLWKEVRTAVLCGISLAAVCFLKVLLVDRLLMHNESISLSVDLVICLALGVTVVMAKMVGCTLPLLAKRLGFDPAVSGLALHHHHCGRTVPAGVLPVRKDHPGLWIPPCRGITPKRTVKSNRMINPARAFARAGNLFTYSMLRTG